VRHRIVLRATLSSIVLACSACAFALNPSLDVSQYAHTAWKVSDGFTQGAILAIAQTPDGYLWLGTEFGLYRFDGVHAVPWQPPAGQDLPSQNIYSLLVARDGTLWIGTDGGGASWKDGELTRYPELDGQTIHSFLEDREGTIWTSGEKVFSAPNICAIVKTSIHCYGKDGSLGADWIVSLYEDKKGSLWAIGRHGLWRWRPGPPKFYPLSFGPDNLHGLAEDNAGKLLIGIEGEFDSSSMEKLRRIRCPATCSPLPPERCSATMTGASGSLSTMRALCISITEERTCSDKQMVYRAMRLWPSMKIEKTISGFRRIAASIAFEKPRSLPSR
jgi:ligand-binding sensor domain-containing protein